MSINVWQSHYNTYKLALPLIESNLVTSLHHVYRFAYFPVMSAFCQFGLFWDSLSCTAF